MPSLDNPPTPGGAHGRTLPGAGGWTGLRPAILLAGLSWEECKQRCPSGVVPACHNSEDTVTISGPQVGPATIAGLLSPAFCSGPAWEARPPQSVYQVLKGPAGELHLSQALWMRPKLGGLCLTRESQSRPL